jgi:formamidopyrimidine-DNA glycosylase
MPELPEVEAVVRKLNQARPWEVIVSHGQYRPTTAQGLERAAGQRLAAVERRGKNIVLTFDSGDFLRVHLKMTGNLLVIPDARLRPATVRAWLGLRDGRGLVLNDPRALGRLTFHAAGELLFQELGLEPFDPLFTPAYLAARAKATAKPIKLFLMEQTVVVGLGNIYAAEALFQAGIHPAKPAAEISAARLRRLHAAIVEVLTVAINSAVRAYEEPGRFSEGEDYPVAVYGREGEPCFRCQAVIRRIPQGGRSTYYCPRCQK